MLVFGLGLGRKAIIFDLGLVSSALTLFWCYGPRWHYCTELEKRDFQKQLKCFCCTNIANGYSQPWFKAPDCNLHLASKNSFERLTPKFYKLTNYLASLVETEKQFRSRTTLEEVSSEEVCPADVSIACCQHCFYQRTLQHVLSMCRSTVLFDFRSTTFENKTRGNITFYSSIYLNIGWKIAVTHAFIALRSAINFFFQQHIYVQCRAVPEVIYEYLFI